MKYSVFVRNIFCVSSQFIISFDFIFPSVIKVLNYYNDCYPLGSSNFKVTISMYNIFQTSKRHKEK